jgi:hypothetical protein
MLRSLLPSVNVIAESLTDRNWPECFFELVSTIFIFWPSFKPPSAAHEPDWAIEGQANMSTNKAGNTLRMLAPHT